MAYCTNCGGSVDPSDDYCNSCGNRLTKSQRTSRVASKSVTHGQTFCPIGNRAILKPNRLYGADCPFCGVPLPAKKRVLLVTVDDEGNAISSELVPKPPVWKRPPFIIAMVLLGLLVGSAVLGSIGGASSTSNGSDDDVPGGGATATTKVTTTRAPLPGIGDEVHDGKFAFRVEDVESPGRVYSPDGVLEDVANGKWFIVHLTVGNIGDQEQTFFAGNQILLWNGTELEGADFTWNGTNIEQLNPGVAVAAIVMFDVPPGFPDSGVGAILEVHDSAFSGGAEIEF